MRRVRKLVNYIINARAIKKNEIEVGKNVTINGIPKFFCKKGTIIIGEETRINSGIRYNPIGGDNQTIFATKEEGNIIIGNNVGISNSTFVARKKIVIEDDVMIGGGCKIYDNDFHSINYESRMMKPDMGIVSKPIVIRRGAFIGAHSIILKGITIGEKAVIGAGSVVTKDVPSGEIWAGNPAKFVKKVD